MITIIDLVLIVYIHYTSLYSIHQTSAELILLWLLVCNWSCPLWPVIGKFFGIGAIDLPLVLGRCNIPPQWSSIPSASQCHWGCTAKYLVGVERYHTKWPAKKQFRCTSLYIYSYNLVHRQCMGVTRSYHTLSKVDCRTYTMLLWLLW